MFCNLQSSTSIFSFSLTSLINIHSICGNTYYLKALRFLFPLDFSHIEFTLKSSSIFPFNLGQVTDNVELDLLIQVALGILLIAVFLIGIYILFMIFLNQFTIKHHNQMGVKLLKRGNFKSAYIEFQRAIQLGGGKKYQNWETLRNLGLLYEGLGNYPKSIYYYTVALNLRKSALGNILAFIFLFLIAGPVAITVPFRAVLNRGSQLTRSDRRLLLTSLLILSFPLVIFLLFLVVVAVADFAEGGDGLSGETLAATIVFSLLTPLIALTLMAFSIIEVIQIWDQTYKRNQVFLLTVTVPYLLISPLVILSISLSSNAWPLLIYFITYCFLTRIRIQRTKNLQRGQLLYDLGRLDVSLGQYSRGTEHFKEILRIAKDTHTIGLEGDALNGLGLIYLAQGDFYQSIEYFAQAKFALSHIAKHQQAEPIRYGETLVNLGANYTKINQHHQAFKYYLEASEVADAQESIFLKKLVLLYQGIAHEDLKTYQKALENINQVLEGIEEVGLPATQAIALHHKASTVYKLGEAKEAAKLLRSAISVLESLRSSDLGDAEKISIFEIQTGTYQLLQKVLIDQEEFNQALEVSERGRARAFIDLMVQRISPEQFDDYLHTQMVQPPSLEKIQQIAQSHQATLVEYSLAEAATLYTWVVKPTGESIFRRIELGDSKVPLDQLIKLTQGKLVPDNRPGREQEEAEASLESLIRGFYEDIEQIDGRDSTLTNQTNAVAFRSLSNDATRRLQQLYRLLIEPIEDLLPGDPNEHLIFLPHRKLFEVPFVALQDAEGQYLIQKHTILTAPSIQVLDLTYQQQQRLQVAKEKRKATTISDCLIVGNPTMPTVSFSSDSLKSLDGAAHEARTLAQLFNTQPLTGDRATETEVTRRMETAQLIHLATHGLPDELEGGAPGAIALAPCAEKDGWLTPSDIVALTLQCELVVLSCCQTGRGRITGDGVVGLSRAFMTAGAPSIIVSLWSIPDAPTASLMEVFYRKWQSGLDKAQALRQAMLTTMKTHPHPRNWAAFTLMGEAD